MVSLSKNNAKTRRRISSLSVRMIMLTFVVLGLAIITIAPIVVFSSEPTTTTTTTTKGSHNHEHDPPVETDGIHDAAIIPMKESVARMMSNAAGLSSSSHSPTTTSMTTKWIPSNKKKGRFPSYGTPEFDKICNWTAYTPLPRDCIILGRLVASGEGLASWTSNIVGGHIMSKQTGCQLLIDFGQDIALHHVLQPVSINWTVPLMMSSKNKQKKFFCSHKNKCGTVAHQYNQQKLNEIERLTGATNLVEVLQYRFAYSARLTKYEEHDRFKNIASVIPGFDVPTGMSCSMESLFRLAPTASQFEPTLFDTILPTLHSSTVLAMAVYVRTGRTEDMTVPDDDADGKKMKQIERIASCAEHVEQLLFNKKEHTEIVWMLITDSPLVKQIVQERFTRKNHTLSSSSSSTSSVSSPRRRVLTTQSRGAHTNPKYSPSTADFAEAFIDWYLLGEGDVVVADTASISYGKTGAFRTQRPYYEISIDNVCDLILPVIR